MQWRTYRTFVVQSSVSCKINVFSEIEKLLQEEICWRNLFIRKYSYEELNNCSISKKTQNISENRDESHKIDIRLFGGHDSHVRHCISFLF